MSGGGEPSEAELRLIREWAKAGSKAIGAGNDDAEDAAQIVLYRLFDRWNDAKIQAARSGTKAQWENYVRMAGRNATLDIWRSNDRRKGREEVYCHDAAPAPDLEEEVLSDGAIEAALDQIPPREAEIVRLRLDGMAISDIARQKGESRNTISGRWRRARRRLKRLLQDEEAES